MVSDACTEGNLTPSEGQLINLYAIKWHVNCVCTTVRDKNLFTPNISVFKTEINFPHFFKVQVYKRLIRENNGGVTFIV